MKIIENYIIKGMLDNAMRECIHLIEKNHDSEVLLQGYRYLGYILLEKGQNDAAIAEINRALSLNRDQDTFIEFGHLAMCYSRTGRLENAMFFVDRAIEAAEKINHRGAKYEWYNYRAVILFKMGRYAEALTCCKKSYGCIPEDYNEEEVIMAKNYLMILYFPLLTQFRIYMAQRNYEAAAPLHKRLGAMFQKIKKPVLHITKDIRTFQELEKKYKKAILDAQR